VRSMFFRSGLGPYLVLAMAAWMACAASAEAKCRMKQPDLSISGIQLTDSASAIRVVGESPPLAETEDDLPHARFVSTNGAQELVLFAHYGAVLDEYAEVEVRIAGPEALALKDLPIESFKTGRGVELGMTSAQVLALFGNCLKSRQKSGSGLFLEYEIADADRDDELKGYGFPVYYAEYEFKSDKLIRYRFGFAYP
jgi:hypothetical protein